MDVYEGLVKAITPETQFAGFSFMLELGNRTIWVVPYQHVLIQPAVGQKVQVLGSWSHPENVEAKKEPLFRAREVRLI